MRFREELGGSTEETVWEQVCSGRMEVCTDGNIFQIGDSAELNMWNSEFLLSLISEVIGCC